MQNQGTRKLVAFSILTLLASLFWTLPAGAQQFSAWLPPVNLNNIVLSDGTVCPAEVNSTFNDTHPALSKDGLSL